MSTLDFGTLFSHYKPQFVVVARSYVRDEMEAEDLVMDSFTSFLEKQDEIDIPPDKIPAYILASVKNRCLNWLRDRKKHMQVHQDLHTEALYMTESRIATLEAFDPDFLFADEIGVIIRRELEKMPEMTRLIFLASRYYDKTYKEIAAEYGVTVNQVEFALEKATKILRAALKDYVT